MMLEDEYHARQQNEAQQYLDLFVSRLDIEEDLAMALVEMGFTSLEEIAYVPAETFDEIEMMLKLLNYFKVVPKKLHWLMHYSSKKTSKIQARNSLQWKG